MKRSFVLSFAAAVLCLGAVSAAFAGAAHPGQMLDFLQANALHALQLGAMLAAGPAAFVLERKNDNGGGGGDGGVAEIKQLLQKQGEAWEEFKRTNDERLSKLAKGEAVADHETKLAKINETLTELGNNLKDLAVKANRPNLGGGGASEAEARELKSFNRVAQAAAIAGGRAFTALNDPGYAAYKAALSSFIRRGVQNMTPEEVKAINVGTDPQGGYLVGEDMESGIDRVVRRYGAMRQLARVIPIGNASYKKLVKTSGVSGGKRGGETTAPAEGTSPQWAELEFRPGTYTSDQRITSEALEDAVQDVESDLIEEMGIEYAEMEGQDFIDGPGINGPRGILAYDMVDNSAYAWGKVGYKVTGGAAGFAASNPSDALIDLQHSLKRQYRANASWSMNDATLGTIRKFKDGNGLYLWAPSALMQGAVGQLLGHPVVTDDFMPDLGAGAFPILFADFNRAYYVVDRKGVTILRDPFSAHPYVVFKGRRRVGGGIANFEALKALKCST